MGLLTLHPSTHPSASHWHLSRVWPLPQIQHTRSSYGALPNRNTSGDRITASYSPLLTSPQTFPYKLSPRTSSSPHSRTKPPGFFSVLKSLSAGIIAPLHSGNLGLAKGQTKKKKGNKSKQKNSPDPPITHIQKSRLVGRGSSHQHLLGGGARGPLIVLPPQA